jgi:hypothetical protein
LQSPRPSDGSPFEAKADGVDLPALASSDVFNLMVGEKNRGLGFNFNGRVLAANLD